MSIGSRRISGPTASSARRGRRCRRICRSPRLGARVLDLLDDMSNAGRKKFVLAEADLFRMEPDYESYAHMNINYLELEQRAALRGRLAARAGCAEIRRFFATTGEVLIPRFTVGGQAKRRNARRVSRRRKSSMLEAAMEWTFPAGLCRDHLRATA